MTDIKEMLYELGYSNISEYPREYRTRPVYRESDNNTVLRIDKATGRFVDFAENISGSFEAGDYSPAMLRIVREHYGDRIRARQFDAQELPYGDGSKDVLILFEALTMSKTSTS